LLGHFLELCKGLSSWATSWTMRRNSTTLPLLAGYCRPDFYACVRDITPNNSNKAALATSKLFKQQMDNGM